MSEIHMMDNHTPHCQCHACRCWHEVSTMTDEEVNARLVENMGSQEAVDASVERSVERMKAWVQVLLRRRRGETEH